MTDQLRAALEAIASRGTPVGAEAAVDRAVADAGSRRSRRWVQAAVAVAAAVMLVAGAATVYVKQRVDDIDRLDLRQSLALGGADVPNEPMNVLLIGTDGARADAIAVIQTVPTDKRVSLLWIPRDLWLDDEKRRISATLADGPAALIAAVGKVTGLSIHHYAQASFDGFKRMVDAVGGVELRFTTPARDRMSGLQVEAGCVRLDGAQALAFVRSRHFETLADGRWRPDPSGDIGRIQRQQEFLRTLAAEMSDVNPVQLNRLIDAAADHLTLDSAFSTAALRRLAVLFKVAGPAGIETSTLPTEPVVIGGTVALRLAAPPPGTPAPPRQSTAPVAVDCRTG